MRAQRSEVTRAASEAGVSPVSQTPSLRFLLPPAPRALCPQAPGPARPLPPQMLGPEDKGHQPALLGGPCSPLLATGP